MSEINKQEIAALAALTRLKLREEEQESLRRDIGSILDYVRQIGQVKNQAAQADGVFGLIKNKFRPPAEPPAGGDCSEEILCQAPQREGNYFKVKKIL